MAYNIFGVNPAELDLWRRAFERRTFPELTDYAANPPYRATGRRVDRIWIDEHGSTQNVNIDEQEALMPDPARVEYIPPEEAVVQQYRTSQINITEDTQNTAGFSITQLIGDDAPADRSAPIYTIQQDTAALEIDELSSNYPARVRNGNYQQPLHETLRDHINDVKNVIRSVRNIQLVYSVLENATPKNRRTMESQLPKFISDRTRCRILDGQPIDRVINLTGITTVISAYRETKAQTIRDRKIYGPQQAEYMQRVAMIRQRPAIEVSIDTQQVMDTISQWDNVFGVAVNVDRHNNLNLRVGLCGIGMKESAAESRYDRPEEIMLAPFYVTVRLDQQGRFVCQSQERNALGVSRDCNGSDVSYDFHPHQLSDSPCFGSFGQPLINMANTGDLISFMSTLIAFYSQYNSQDSAGVQARYYHPDHMGFDDDECILKIVDGISEFSPHDQYLDIAKLDVAVAAYNNYRESCGSAPELTCQNYCYNCEEEPVDDNNMYFTDAGGNRVCESCWDNAYCGDCEHCNEDCICDPDDAY